MEQYLTLFLSGLGGGGIAALIIGGIALIMIIWAIAVRNTFARTKVKIGEADSGIDVALQKRFDLLTKALNTAKGFAKHEREVLTEVIKLRKGMSMEEKAQANKQLDDLKSSINVLAEAYPQLRSSDVFVSLQKAISDAEEHLQAARRLYNANVSVFNQMLVTFPQSVIGGMMRLTEFKFFMAEEGKKKDVDMSF